MENTNKFLPSVLRRRPRRKPQIINNVERGAEDNNESAPKEASILDSVAQHASPVNIRQEMLEGEDAVDAVKNLEHELALHGDNQKAYESSV